MSPLESPLEECLLEPLPASPAELQAQLELLLLFCDDTQLAAGGMTRASAHRLLGSQKDWNYAETMAVMTVLDVDFPYAT